MSGRWQAAVAYALTGEELVLSETGTPEVDLLLGELARAGWTPERISQHAAAESRSGVWPHPIPTELREQCSAAQLAAVLAQVREQLGLGSVSVALPSNRRQLDADEQRLMREVPPHHVG